MAVIDPYRTLGLRYGATIDEVKAAYRRLAKRYHPDSAGPAAIPRFLEVQHAYEMLVSTRPRRTAGQPRSTRPTPSPLHASPGPRQAPASGGPGPSARRARPRNEPGQGFAGQAATGQGATGRSERPRAGRRKATLGSTSYDEASTGSLDPGWAGASWYGTDSGTYWTVNPREYADPRKHGPEYQERARRAATGEPAPDGRSQRVGTEWSERDVWGSADRAARERGPSVVDAGPRYREIVAVGLALIGTAVGLMAIFALFART